MNFSKVSKMLLLRCLAPAILFSAAIFPTTAVHAENLVWTSDFRIGGCGGAYFLAEPGELWVEVEKQDLNRRGRKTHVRAILFGPDRSVVADEYLPWMAMEKGSGDGPVQRLRFSVEVPRTGVYGLSITASEDRYGDDMVWGMRTNCPKYLVETSRGHKDERHQEPLVLQQGDVPGSVCFLPRSGSFTLDVTGVRGETLRLLDSTGAEIAPVPVDAEGTATLTVPAGDRENIPWQLHLSGANGTVNIDGVTRWERIDGGLEDISLWTPRAETWFPFHDNRWLLTPYKRRMNVVSGEEGTVEFEVYNSGRQPKSVMLTFAGPEAATFRLSESTLDMAPGERRKVTVQYEGVPATVQLQARTDDGFSTWSTLELVPDSGLLEKALDLPLVLKPFRHENAQFAYAPEYPVTNEVYFDRHNQPLITARGGLNYRAEGQWVEAAMGSLLDSKVAVDEDNDIYLLAQKDGASALYHAKDGTKDFTAYPVPGKGPFDTEQFSGHNVATGPPAFVRFTRTAVDPKLKWRRVHDLDLFVPEKTAEGTIVIGAPIRLSETCIGISSHSGIPSTTVSRGSKVHVTWGEATTPDENVPGVPTYVATYDRETKRLSDASLVGYGPPANDVHNTPSITMDSQGYLHVLVGTHGSTFLYAKSLQPNDASGGWSEPEPLGPGLRQTYVGFVCGPDDTLHVVFRLWHTDTTYFPASHYATLSYMQKKPGEAWSEPRALVVPPFSEYSVFYHRLTIDRTGRLFLSYDYWSTYWFYRTDRWETRRALMMSADGGATWKMAADADLTP